MMMKRWMAAAALCAMSSGAFADGTYDFDSFTEISISGTEFSGVLVGDTVPTTMTVQATHGQCYTWMQLMMTNPGTLTLNLTVVTVPPSMGFPAVTNVTTCRLKAKT